MHVFPGMAARTRCNPHMAENFIFPFTIEPQSPEVTNSAGIEIPAVVFNI